MEFREVKALHGPNVWARCSVLEVVVDLASLKGRPIDAFPGFAERLRHRLPSLGGVEELFDPGRALGLATLELQCLAGSPVAFVAEQPGGAPGVVRVAIEYEEEPIVRLALEAGRDLCLAALDDLPFDVDEEVARLAEIADDARLGPSTRSIVEAARARGIPTRRLDPPGSLVLLGQGARQRRIRTAETDATGALAESIAQDKDLTKTLLRAVGVPIPEGRPVVDADDAWIAAEEVGLPVVVKPLDGNHGRGVATDLTTRDQVFVAYAAARAEGSKVLVERLIRGSDYRLLVVGDRLVAAARRDPAHVVGDGVSTVIELVEAVNRDPRRGEGHASSLTRIKLDDPIALAVLAEQGSAPDSVPPFGALVLIRRNANLSTGGTAEDVTDRVHPDVAARAVEAARVIGLDVAGVDLVADGVDRPLERSGGAVVEVNAGPGLRMHLEPSSGTPRPVGASIVARLFPEGQTGRISVVAVLGADADSAVPGLVASVLSTSGRRVGLADSGGISVDGRRLLQGDHRGPEGALRVLLNPAVEAAVFDLAPAMVLVEGLGFELADVALILGSVDPEAARVVVESVDARGWLVLDAADPGAVGLAGLSPARVILVSTDPALPAILDHLRSGGRAVFVRDGGLILAEGRDESIRVDGSFAVDDLLAAAVAWALGLEPATMIGP